jgi:hypothetical protein
MDKERIDALVKDFNRAIMPFGSHDVYVVMKWADSVNMTAEEVVDLLLEQAEDLGVNITKLDPCYEILEHILQMAGNYIDEIIGYDLVNDNNGSIYTYGNYMDSSYNYSEKDVDDLQSKINQATQEQKDMLLTDDFVRFLFEKLEIEIT